MKAHLVCPDEGICHQKVITGCRVSGHGLIRKFVVSRVEVETSKLDGPRTRSLGSSIFDPRPVRYFCFDYGALDCVQEEEMDVGRVVSRDDPDLVTSGVIGTFLIT